MGGVLGDVTDFVGLTDYEGQENAQQAAVDASNRASANALKMAEDNIAFQKEQYTDWKAVYGELQDNLGDYYNNLSSSKYATQAIQANQQEFAKTSKQLDTSLAQRGLSSSGAQAASMTAMSQQLAQANATARYTAQDTVKQQQLGFLGVGLGQGSSMLGNIGTAYNNGSSTSVQGGQLTAGAYQNQSSMIGGLNASTVNLLGEVTGGAMKGGGFSGVTSTLFGSDIRFKNNIKYTKTINNVNFYTWYWNDIAIKLGYNNSIPSGVIAQELRFTHPDCIVVNTDGYYMVDYGKLYSILGVNNG